MLEVQQAESEVRKSTFIIDGVEVATPLSRTELEADDSDNGRRIQLRHLPDTGEPAILRSTGTLPDGRAVDIVQGADGLHWMPIKEIPESAVSSNSSETSQAEVAAQSVRRNLGQRMLGRLFRNNEKEHWVGNPGALTPSSNQNPDLQRMTIIDHTGKEPQKTIIANNYDSNH